jgi:hypothetical protein
MKTAGLKNPLTYPTAQVKFDCPAFSKTQAGEHVQNKENAS